jgi:hypothetical protein
LNDFRTSVVGLTAADHFLKYHRLFISSYLAHTCISALNAHTFYQSTRRLSTCTGSRNLSFSGKGAIVKWIVYKYLVTQEGSEFFSAEERSRLLLKMFNGVILFFLSSSMKY